MCVIHGSKEIYADVKDHPHIISSPCRSLMVWQLEMWGWRSNPLLRPSKLSFSSKLLSSETFFFVSVFFTFTFTFTREHNRIAKKINPLVWGELRKMWKTLFIGWRLERIAQLGEELVYQVTISKISGLSIFPSKSCNRQQKQSVPFNFLQTPLFYRSPDSWLGHSFRILSTGYFIHFVIDTINMKTFHFHEVYISQMSNCLKFGHHE